jgi:hypothetical protein
MNEILKITSLIIFLLIFSPIHAAIIVVNNGQDLMALDGNCDLRDAINSANVNFSVDNCNAGETGVQDIIIVQVPGPIQLSATIPVFSSVTIGTNFNVEPIEIIAAQNSRIFRVSPNSINDNNFSIANFKLINGDAGIDEGGAILFTGNAATLGDIAINNVIFENNHATIGGALSFDDTRADSVIINGNTFENNSADSFAGAISAVRFAISVNETNVEINNNKFLNNRSQDTIGAVFIRNEAINNFSIMLNDNLFMNNTAVNSVGALSLQADFLRQNYQLNRNIFLFNQAGGSAGALQTGFSSVVSVDDSLFAFNQAERGGAVTSISDDALLRLSSSTLAYNQASLAGDNVYIFSSGRFLPAHNIIAYPVNGDNCFGSLGLASNNGVSNNLVDDSTCEMINNTPGIQMADPLLSSYVASGDRFPGLVPSEGSFAIDATGFCGEFDARGQARPVDGDANGSAICDIGGIEATDSDNISISIFIDGFES